MDTEFWQQRWQNHQIGFHQARVNPYLIQYIKNFELPKHARIFVPLCGKTLDISWLLAQGYRVCAIELSSLAIEQLFSELDIPYQITVQDQLHYYQAEHLDVYVGNIFDLQQNQLDQVDAVYDRAALVALPLDMRKKYTQYLIQLTQAAPQLLISYDYPQQLYAGPPFAVSEHEILRHYQSSYEITLLQRHVLIEDKLVEKFKGQGTIDENIWQLMPKSHR